MVGADLARGAQALVGVARRHPDVDHGDVGLVGADLAEQVLGVAGLAGDLESRVLEQAHEALAQQHGVLGDDDLQWAISCAHTGISARRVVPDPGGRVECQRSIQCADAVGEAAQARPAAGIRAADSIVAHFDVRVAIYPPHGDRGRARVGVLGHVGQRLGDHEVGRGLDRLGQPLAGNLDDLDRQRRADGERLDRRAEPAIGQHGRVDAAGELAQLLERARQLLLGRADHRRGLLRRLARSGSGRSGA